MGVAGGVLGGDGCCFELLDGAHFWFCFYLFGMADMVRLSRLEVVERGGDGGVGCR